MKSHRVAVLLTVVIAMAASTAPVVSEETYDAQIDALRQSLEKYKDVYAAVHDGYFSTVGCVHYSGEKTDGYVPYDKGAMGIHFFNPALAAPPPNPERPPILIYEPVGDELQLVAVEWFVTLASGVKERPVLFGQPFLGPMEGHEPLIPREVSHYDLHAWLFKDNPYGLFAPTNPEVVCDASPYSLLEEPTKLVPEP